MKYPVIHWAGDSTVKKNNINRFPQTGIGQNFNLFLKPEIMVMNYAENGRSTKSFLDEGRAKDIDENLKPGDFLFIQFGHNDEKKQDPLRFTEPFGEFTENLRYFIELARKHEAYPLLITPLYRRCFSADSKTVLTASHLSYPDAMLALAKAENVPCIDLCSLSKKLIEKAGPEETVSWFMHLSDGLYYHYKEQTDNTHLQPKGAMIFGSIIADELAKLTAPYCDLLIPLEEAKSYQEITTYSFAPTESSTVIDTTEL